MGTKLLRALICFFFIVTIIKSNLFAQNKYALGIHAGTTGFGGSAIIRINDKINTRLSYEGIDYNQAGTYEDLELMLSYDGNADISSFSVIADVFPFKRFFKISAGLYHMNWESSAIFLPNEPYQIEDRTFEPDRIGSLTTYMSYSKKIAPYMGVGFGNALAKGVPVKLNVDLGLIRTGAPIIEMEGTGMIASTADNEASFQKGFDEFEWYPIIRIGLSLAFTKVE